MFACIAPSDSLQHTQSGLKQTAGLGDSSRLLCHPILLGRILPGWSPSLFGRLPQLNISALGTSVLLEPISCSTFRYSEASLAKCPSLCHNSLFRVGAELLFISAQGISCFATCLCTLARQLIEGHVILVHGSECILWPINAVLSIGSCSHWVCNMHAVDNFACKASVNVCTHLQMINSLFTHMRCTNSVRWYCRQLSSQQTVSLASLANSTIW